MADEKAIHDEQEMSAIERRRWHDQRKNRAREGRERYLDMVQRERRLFIDQGVVRSVEQLLDSTGTVQVSESDDEAIVRDRASGDQLRQALPSQVWMPLSIHLIGLQDAVLSIAPLNEFTDRQGDAILSVMRRSGFKVDSIEVEVWDRMELMNTLRSIQDLSADRSEKTLAQWLLDLDNGLMLNQFMRDMLAEALQMRASDIHLVYEPSLDSPCWIKYRIDGDLLPLHILPNDAMARLTTLLKRDAGLNFGDRTTPKDGRFSFVWQGRSIDVRVAAGPQAQEGEKLTLRLLDRAALKGFDDLFRRHSDIGDYLSRLLSPELKGGGGLILLSGPTGSGKTTTLYACVQQIDRRRKHVLTIEDPIEYELRYATQWQVRHGFDGGEFADLIRASLRHDPDYIVIGEMRDGETVETSLRAAESGHTVISTIHADTSIQTFERLRSMMPFERTRSSTFTLAQQARAILNQRLVRTLCQGCSTPSRADEILDSDEYIQLNIVPEEKVRKHNPSGCDLCNRTGYLGRTLLLDAVLITASSNQRDPIFKALMENVSEITECDGVIFHSRKAALQDLVKEGLIDPKAALGFIEE